MKSPSTDQSDPWKIGSPFLEDRLDLGAQIVRGPKGFSKGSRHLGSFSLLDEPQ